MYCRAHKTATLTPIQHTVCVGGGVKNWSNFGTDSSKKLPTEAQFQYFWSE